MACDIANLGSCIVQSFFDYLSGILNQGIQPLLTLTKSLLSEQVNLSLFSSLWAMIVYILSMFYALLIIYSGFQFIISSQNPEKREAAKAWLKNIVIMIILVQASFFLYELAIELSSSLTSATMTLIPGNFFLLTMDNSSNSALSLIFFFLYIVTLLLTSLILTLRYGIVALGVVLFPLAIFFYFIEPLKPYGEILVNFLGIAAFLTFLDSIILAGFSKLIDVPLFADLKILVMVAAFGLIDLMMFFLLFFSAIKAGFNVKNKVYGSIK